MNLQWSRLVLLYVGKFTFLCTCEYHYIGVHMHIVHMYRLLHQRTQHIHVNVSTRILISTLLIMYIYTCVHMYKILVVHMYTGVGVHPTTILSKHQN